MIKMESGKRYRIIYRGDIHRVNRMAVLDYLDEDGDSWVLNARPTAGTQTMPKHWVKDIEEVPKSTPIAINVRWR